MLHREADEVEREQVVIGEQRGADYYAVKQVDERPDMCGPMDGGNLATSCDSRVRKIYHVHDRYDTAEMNALLSI